MHTQRAGHKRMKGERGGRYSPRRQGRSRCRPRRGGRRKAESGGGACGRGPTSAPAASSPARCRRADSAGWAPAEWGPGPRRRMGPPVAVRPPPLGGSPLASGVPTCSRGVAVLGRPPAAASSLRRCLACASCVRVWRPPLSGGPPLAVPNPLIHRRKEVTLFTPARVSPPFSVIVIGSWAWGQRKRNGRRRRRIKKEETQAGGEAERSLRPSLWSHAYPPDVKLSPCVFCLQGQKLDV